MKNPSITEGCNYFVSIGDSAGADLIGRKGMNLYLLYKGGFNIPQTYCVTTEAHKDFIRENKLFGYIGQILADDGTSFHDKSEKIIALVMQADFPGALLMELAASEVLKRGKARWAVRSSSNLEDIHSASFSGLYDSYLDVTGLDNILLSIKKCWASVWNERALVYRRRKGLDQMQASMAVLVQCMVDAAYSGVFFTGNPISTEKDKMYMEYCEGSGDRLVSGMINPHSVEIDRTGHVIKHNSARDSKGFGDDDVNRLSRLALEIEDYFGFPQDIEWAMTDGQFFVLQARPITGSAVAMPLDQIWTRANIGEVLPDVVTPLTWDVFRRTLLNKPSLTTRSPNERGYRSTAVKRISGRAYLRLDSLLNAFCYLPTVTPHVMSKVLGVNLPVSADNYVRPSGFLVRLSQSAFIMESLGILPRLRRIVRRLPTPPGNCPDKIDELLAWTAHCFLIHRKCTAYAIGSFSLLSCLLRRCVPEKADELLPEILVGREDLQAATQRNSLRQMADYVRINSAIKDILECGADLAVIRRRLLDVEAGQHFLEMLDEFMCSNGARAAGELEMAVPRWQEDPTFVLGAIRKFIDSEENMRADAPGLRRSRQAAAVKTIESTMKPGMRWAFCRLLDSYSEYVTFRENVKYRLVEGYFLLRQAFMKIGSELVAGGLLDKPEDIFFLSAPEVVARDNPVGRKRELIRARREQHALWESTAVPDLIMGDDFETPAYCCSDLTGIGCSPGIGEGNARVLLDVSEAGLLQPGEILVSPHTDPGWTPLFLTCRALVTEIGGFLSHGATVAREYGIPAVVNVREATKRIRTGDFIRVDGTRGRITICRR